MTRRIGAPLTPEEVWRDLRRGKRVTITRHPRELAGFERARGPVERHGQAEDWTRELPDGSRLHAHVFPDGRITMHRDRWSPKRGPLSTVAHVALETTGGRIALAAVVGRLLGFIP